MTIKAQPELWDKLDQQDSAPWFKNIQQAAFIYAYNKDKPGITLESFQLAIINKLREIEARNPTSTFQIVHEGPVSRANQHMQALNLFLDYALESPAITKDLNLWSQRLLKSVLKPRKATLAERGVTLGNEVITKTTRLTPEGTSTPAELHTDLADTPRQYRHINASIRQSYLSVRHYTATLNNLKNKLPTLDNESTTSCLNLIEQLQIELRYDRRKAQDYTRMLQALTKIKTGISSLDAYTASLAILEGLKAAEKRIAILDKQNEKFKLHQEALLKETTQLQEAVKKIQDIHDKIFASLKKDPWPITQRVIKQAQAYLEMLSKTRKYPGIQHLAGRYSVILDNPKVADQIRLSRDSIQEILLDRDQ